MHSNSIERHLDDAFRTTLEEWERQCRALAEVLRIAPDADAVREAGEFGREVLLESDNAFSALLEVSRFLTRRQARQALGCPTFGTPTAPPSEDPSELLRALVTLAHHVRWLRRTIYPDAPESRAVLDYDRQTLVWHGRTIHLGESEALAVWHVARDPVGTRKGESSFERDAAPGKQAVSTPDGKRHIMSFPDAMAGVTRKLRREGLPRLFRGFPRIGGWAATTVISIQPTPRSQAG